MTMESSPGLERIKCTKAYQKHKAMPLEPTGWYPTSKTPNPQWTKPRMRTWTNITRPTIMLTTLPTRSLLLLLNLVQLNQPCSKHRSSLDQWNSLKRDQLLKTRTILLCKLKLRDLLMLSITLGLLSTVLCLTPQFHRQLHLKLTTSTRINQGNRFLL